MDIRRVYPFSKTFSNEMSCDKLKEGMIKGRTKS
jgi:hypothetical protein